MNTDNRPVLSLSPSNGERRLRVPESRLIQKRCHWSVSRPAYVYFLKDPRYRIGHLPNYSPPSPLLLPNPRSVQSSGPMNNLSDVVWKGHWWQNRGLSCASLSVSPHLLIITPHLLYAR